MADILDSDGSPLVVLTRGYATSLDPRVPQEWLDTPGTYRPEPGAAPVRHSQFHASRSSVTAVIRERSGFCLEVLLT